MDMLAMCAMIVGVVSFIGAVVIYRHAVRLRRKSSHRPWLPSVDSPRLWLAGASTPVVRCAHIDEPTELRCEKPHGHSGGHYFVIRDHRDLYARTPF